ncbi:hypothetical protein A2631_05920 [Candidatus Daviesbacteria bacterium RIFCSPHIGHO2_01_FULL_44_29]|nr:MAG: hypothetical protein A2631_05920 [Candidatus Daviesbacteria bacterium RIFCSPHIGHO2_01_FULL_44_29]
MNKKLSDIIQSIKKKIVFRNRKLRGLGVTKNGKSVYLYFTSSKNFDQTFNLAKSDDGYDFSAFRNNLRITDFKYTEKIDTTSDWHFSKIDNYFLLQYLKRNNEKAIFGTATSTDLLHFEYNYYSPSVQEKRLIIPGLNSTQKYIAYGGDDDISVSSSNDLKKWSFIKKNVLARRPSHFDDGQLEVEYVMRMDDGILLFYHSKVLNQEKLQHLVGAAIFDNNNPEKLLWRSSDPVWEQSLDWATKEVYPIGVVFHEGKFISYWGIKEEGIYAVCYSMYKIWDSVRSKNVSLHLKRAKNNPIISPKTDNHWESFNTFNPAALYEDGKVHLLYRAQGYDYISVLGYASSNDGVHIHDRPDKPAYVPTSDFENKESKKFTGNSHPFVSLSGGGYGGAEDPRITRIGDRIYMTYVAFDGMSPQRIALTSIAVDDFLNQRWLWERPVLISPPGVVDKNAVIFPEKIRGKYVIFHRIYPDILIDFVDSLEFDGTTWLKGRYKISPRPNMWDSRKIGAGAPPIKTKDGWLLIYQSVGNQDPGKYKIGAMLLDLDDPTKVLYRSNAPILEPDERYENEGFKSGVVYPCGAVVIKETLFVYYGGADSYVCVATANLNEFLSELKFGHIVRLDPAIINKVM